MWFRIGALVCAGLMASATAAAADCQIKVYADFPLQANAHRALIAGAINHKPTVFIADTGADVSSMPLPNAQTFGVVISGMNDVAVEGIGGRVKTGSAHFDLQLGSYEAPNEAMLVMAMRSLDNRAVALIGRELLMQHDLEINLPGNDMKVVQPLGCTPPQLVYWDKPYSQTPLEGDGTSRPAILVNVLLNGHVTRALVDSGSPQSYVTPAAARGAGANLEAATATAAARGVGGRAEIESRIVRFDTFTIGDETIKNAKLAVADLWKYNKVEETGTRLGNQQHDLAQPRMLLGADFLRAHRVLVANSMGLMVLSYMGGPVFDIAQPPTAPAAPPTSSAPAASKPPPVQR